MLLSTNSDTIMNKQPLAWEKNTAIKLLYANCDTTMNNKKDRNRVIKPL